MIRRNVVKGDWGVVECTWSSGVCAGMRFILLLRQFSENCGATW